MDTEALMREFPLDVVRACCPGKSCGNITLHLKVDAQLRQIDVQYEAVVIVGYQRDNGDWYYGLGPFDSTDKLKNALEEDYTLNAP